MDDQKHRTINKVVSGDWQEQLKDLENESIFLYLKNYLIIFLCLMPYALCLMPYALCLMPYALCLM
ncbi:hypothetical protein, partial [Bartonella sp. AA56HLJMS]|uniref:hypothetical protein n=1 Tax=Bartonella sp. AA56HLJMS TaxID=3243434 RepID=UPI0035CFEF8B